MGGFYSMPSSRFPATEVGGATDGRGCSWKYSVSDPPFRFARSS